LGKQKGEIHKKAICALLSYCSMSRYLKQLKGGEIKIDRARVKAEEALDGKYLLRTSDDTLKPEDVALGYKQQFNKGFAEQRVYRDLSGLGNYRT